MRHQPQHINYNVPDAKWSDIHAVLREARANYCWIFNKLNKKWWTPDEFYDEFHDKDFSNFELIGFLSDISIRDPRAGITAAHKQLEELFEENHNKTKELQKRIEKFNKKVITYYQDMSRPRLG